LNGKNLREVSSNTLYLNNNNNNNSLNVHVDPVNSRVIIVQRRKIEKVVPINTNGVLIATPEQEAFQCRDMKTGRAG